MLRPYKDGLGAETKTVIVRSELMKRSRAIIRFMIAGAMVPVMSAAVTRGSGDQKSSAVDEVFADLTKTGSPGCALGVYRDGQMLYEKGYGLANIEENVPITPKSVFDIGSTSKQFTASSILLLEK